MSTPWSIMESLKKWSRLIENHINALKISEKTRSNCMRSQCRLFQTYTEPDENQVPSSTSSGKKAVDTGISSSTIAASILTKEEDEFILPLSPGALTRNLGLPVVVIVTKVFKIYLDVINIM
jgi:dynein light intermediate chain 1, cytosolic